MKLNILKYTSLGIIGIFLIYANINLAWNMFFRNNDSTGMNLKTFFIPTNEQIADTLIALFPNEFTDNGNSEAKGKKLIANSLLVLDDPIESNKRHITSGDSLIGYAYVIHEKIACPSCSDINYLLITDYGYTIKHIIFLRDIVEDYKIVPVEKFEELSNKFLNRDLYSDNFTGFNTLKAAPKHSVYFHQSIINLKMQIRILYEK